MTGSLLTLPLRLGVRTVRVSLLAGRDLADLGLATLELVERMLGEEAEAGTTEVVDAEVVDMEARAAEAAPVDEAPAEEAPAEEFPAEEAPAEAQEAPAAEEAPAEEILREPSPGAGAPAWPEAEKPTPDDRELVEEVADPGAEEGAGASLRVAPPFPGYDELRAPDVIARLPGVDTAELGETELYERTHRARRTVLDAIAREIRRRPPA